MGAQGTRPWLKRGSPLYYELSLLSWIELLLRIELHNNAFLDSFRHPHLSASYQRRDHNSLAACSQRTHWSWYEFAIGWTRSLHTPKWITRTPSRSHAPHSLKTQKFIISLKTSEFFASSLGWPTSLAFYARRNPHDNLRTQFFRERFDELRWWIHVWWLYDVYLSDGKSIETSDHSQNCLEGHPCHVWTLPSGLNMLFHRCRCLCRLFERMEIDRVTQEPPSR